MRQGLKSGLRRALVKRGISAGTAPRIESLDQHIRGLIDRYDIEVVLDIGANRGDYGRRLRRNVGFRGRIVSFEPDVTPFAVLAESAADDPLWEALPDALGRETEIATLHVYRGHDDFNSLHGLTAFGSEHYPLGRSEEVEVQVKRLDDIATRLPLDGALMIKVDTQGHDLEVLAGSLATLRRCQVLQVEAPLVHLYENSPTLPEYLAFFADQGILPSAMFTAARGPDQELVEVDLLGIRPGGAESSRQLPRPK